MQLVILATILTLSLFMLGTHCVRSQCSPQFHRLTYLQEGLSEWCMRLQEKYTVGLSSPDVPSKKVQQKVPARDDLRDDLSSATLQELAYHFMDLAREADW